MPLSDREYMRASPPSRGGARRYRRTWSFSLSPVWVIIGINFLLFLFTIAWGRGVVNVEGTLVQTYKAHYYLGLMPAAFWSRPWTILTNFFIHANLWHLFGNMITLFFFGSFLSRLVGDGRFLLVYLVGGFMGSVFFLLLGPPYSIAVGASGAVYAIAGALVVMMPNLRVMLYFFIPMPLWLVVLVFMLIWSFIPGIAWQAHVGGLFVGLIAGYFFRKQGLYYYVR